MTLRSAGICLKRSSISPFTLAWTPSKITWVSCWFSSAFALRLSVPWRSRMGPSFPSFLSFSLIRVRSTSTSLSLPSGPSFKANSVLPRLPKSLEWNSSLA